MFFVAAHVNLVPDASEGGSLGLLAPAPCGQCHLFYKPRARRCAFGGVQRLLTVLDPIPERVGQPHQSAPHPSTPNIPVPVVCTIWFSQSHVYSTKSEILMPLPFFFPKGNHVLKKLSKKTHRSGATEGVRGILYPCPSGAVP